MPYCDIAKMLKCYGGLTFSFFCATLKPESQFKQSLNTRGRY